jgi:hypothetical protein
MLRTSALAAILIVSTASAGSAATPDQAADPPATNQERARRVAMVSSPGASEYNLSRSADGRTLVFARSGANFADAKIYWSEVRRGRVTQPEPISFSDPRWRDSDPWLSPDGRTLYFVSDRPTAARPDKRDLDIWRSRRSLTGGWRAPEHLGDTVNSAGEELGPEVHGGRLYFSSARRSGKGGLDVYSAPAVGAGFGAPELLPEPINSAESESDFTISPDGRTALFWRLVAGRGVLHSAERTLEGWGAPTPLPPALNPGGFNFTPAFSADGQRISFASAATGEAPADVFEAERS